MKIVVINNETYVLIEKDNQYKVIAGFYQIKNNEK